MTICALIKLFVLQREVHHTGMQVSEIHPILSYKTSEGVNNIQGQLVEPISATLCYFCNTSVCVLVLIGE